MARSRGPSGRSDGERLALFVRRVDDAIAEDAIQHGTIRTGVSITFTSGQPVEVDEQESTRSHVRSLMLAFRRFHATNEDTHFYAISKMVDRYAVAAGATDVVEANRVNRESWTYLRETGVINISIEEGVHLKPADWLSIILNGGMFHDVPSDVVRYDELDGPALAMGRSIVHNMVIEGLHVLDAERNLITDGVRRGVLPS